MPLRLSGISILHWTRRCQPPYPTSNWCASIIMDLNAKIKGLGCTAPLQSCTRSAVNVDVGSVLLPHSNVVSRVRAGADRTVTDYDSSRIRGPLLPFEIARDQNFRITRKLRGCRVTRWSLGGVSAR